MTILSLTNQRAPRFRTLSTATAALALALCLLLLLAPGVVFDLFGVPASSTAEFLSRRTAMLFLGLAVLTYLARDAQHSVIRQAVLLGAGFTWLGFAVLGTGELARGFAGPGILLAVAAELGFGVSHLAVWSAHRAKPVRAS